MKHPEPAHPAPDRRAIALPLMIIQTVGVVLLFIGQLAVGPGEPLLWAIGAAGVISILVLFTYLRGFEYARHIDVVLVTILVGLGTPEPYLTKISALIVLVPSAIALILVEPIWIILTGLIILVTFTLRVGPEGQFLTAYTNDLRTVGTFILIIGSMYLVRMLAERAQGIAAANLRQAEAALTRAEQQALVLAGQAQALRETTERQQRLLDLVAELEMPAVELADGVLLAPIVGHLDSRRADAFTARLLEQITARRTRLLIIDLVGVKDVDSIVAEVVLRTARAVRLLGCDVTLTGITPDVATVLTRARISFDGIGIARAPQDALAAYQIIRAAAR